MFTEANISATIISSLNIFETWLLTSVHVLNSATTLNGDDGEIPYFAGIELGNGHARITKIFSQ
ncbi:MAG: hypothetical protein FWC68_04435 [Oscillospiraceae bacterium]|nr:hypothetical protein [Oscillospiraceae bacterium]